MDLQVVVDNGEVIAYALAGVVALIGLGIVQLFRRRGDVKKAREAVRLVTWSLAEPRVGPVAVRGRYRPSPELHLVHESGHSIYIDGTPDVVRGTRGRWRSGVRTYELRDGDLAYAIGVMSKRGTSGTEWTMVHSPGESGVQLYAEKPRPVPKPLFPWRALVFLAICGGIGYGALYGAGTVLVDTRECDDSSITKLQIASGLPMVREDALGKLASCHK
ncbi:MAG TPA: hypothetical protein VL326_31630 [Kofleriaceae bacterium]|nr:hypothetical protein [Kofleriaceae bacterium]